MSQSIKGDKTLKIKGKNWKMRADFACIAAIEEEQNAPIAEVLEKRFAEGSMSLFAQVFFQMLQCFHGDDQDLPDWKAAGQVMFNGDVKKVAEAMAHCLAVGLGQNVPVSEGNAPAPKETAAG